MACCNVCYVCKLQHNSFSIPLASDGRAGAKTGQFLLVFDTQITSIREEKAASIFVFTFDALPDAGCNYRYASPSSVLIVIPIYPDKNI